MKRNGFALAIMSVVVAGCGGSQPPIAAPGAMPQGVGTMHRVAPASSYSVLYRFRGRSNGNYPYAGLTNLNGTLYGTTVGGGTTHNGTIFSITTTGEQKVLYSFAGRTDGFKPYAGLIKVNGTLYGTTFGGGYGCGGTVFSVTTTGKEKVLYKFACASSPDGANPYAGLINVGGTLYGTTFYGGSKCYNYGCGTVFSVTTSGTEKVLYMFGEGPDGSGPSASLADLNGRLYGTTVGGGAHNGGTVFSVTMNGKENVLHSFGNPSDGGSPKAGLLNVNGMLYGTTTSGGSGCDLNGCGTVFRITTAGKLKVLYRFGGSPDGAGPYAGLINVNGTLYGTTSQGGVSGVGTVFSVTTAGEEHVLYSFRGGSDGAFPTASLINVKGTLYGTTNGGGSSTCYGGCGTVFALKP